MRKTSGQTWDRLRRINGSRLDESVHLNGAESEVLSERVTGGDEVGALVDDGSSSSLVGFVHDDGEVLGSHKGWDGGLDEIEPLLEPGGGLSDVGEGGDLADGGKKRGVSSLTSEREI